MNIVPRYKAAAIQFDSKLGQVEYNLAGLLALAEQAARGGCRLIVLPETATTGYGFQDRAEIAPLLEAIPGPSTDRFAALAAEYGCYILVGLAEIDPVTGAAYNAAAFVGPGGLTGRMRKVHLTEGDSRWARPGDLGYPVWETEIGRIAAHICRDACHPEAARSAALEGAEVIALPTAWDSERAPALDWFSRAYENSVYYAAADQHGNTRGTQFSGGTCIIGPGGDLLASLDTGDGIVEAEIDLERTRALAFGARDGGQKFGERRPGCYTDLALSPLRWPLGSKRTIYSARPLPEGKPFGIAVLQPGDVPTERAAAQAYYEALIETALGQAETRLELVVLPELALLADTTRAATEAETLPGPASEWAAGLCRTHGLHLVFGLAEQGEAGRVFNSAALVGREGLIGVCRQLHVAARDRSWATPGDEPPRTWDLPLGRVGLIIGHDALFPETARCLAIQGADVIAAPSAVAGPLPISLPPTAVPLAPEVLSAPAEGHWHLWRGRAGENACYLAFANRGDAPHMGWTGVFGPDLFRYPRVERFTAGAGEAVMCLAADTRDYLGPERPNPVRVKTFVRERNTQFLDPILIQR